VTFKTQAMANSHFLYQQALFHKASKLLT